MTTVALFNIVFVLLAYLAQYKNQEYLLKFSFFLIFLFLALRYDYGNDYQSYLNVFLNLERSGSIDRFYDSNDHFELGWLYLCQLFQPLGFFAMVTMLAAFNCFIYYSFIKKFVPPHYYWFSLLLYTFDPGMMLVHSSAMRQSLAISIFIYSIEFIYKKNILLYFLCIGLASLFHSSAIALLPIYLLGIYKWRITKKQAIFILITYMSLFVFGKKIISSIIPFIESYNIKYELLEEEGVVGSGLGMIFSFFILGFILFYDSVETRRNALLFKIASLTYFIIPIGLEFASIARIAMYFQPITLAVLPLILVKIKDSRQRILFLFILIIFALWGFYRFFDSEVWVDAFGKYQTIFSSPEIY